jgi:hypothetical protein
MCDWGCGMRLLVQVGMALITTTTNELNHGTKQIGTIQGVEKFHSRKFRFMI